MNSETISANSVGLKRPPVPSGKIPRSRRKLRYELFEKLGCGGNGTVFRAHDRELNRIVAVKILHSQLIPGLLGLLRLKREVVLASRVQSQHVVRVYDFGESEGRPLVAMEWINGESVAVLLCRVGRLPPAQVLALSIDICRGLQDVHAAGVVHRDIKPGNILIDNRGNALLSDFGLACSICPSDYSRADHEEVRGTAAYASPEQLAGLPVDERSDIYSLGMLLLTMLTGSTCLDTLDSVGNILRSSQQDRFARNHNLRILADFRSIITRCTQQSRTSRPGSVLEVLEVLQDIDKSPPRPEPTQPSLWPWPRVRNYRWIVMGLAATIVCAVCVWVNWHDVHANSVSAGIVPATDSGRAAYLDALSKMGPNRPKEDLEQALKALQAAVDQNSRDLPARHAYLDVIIQLYEKSRDKQLLNLGRVALRNARASGMTESACLLFEARLDLYSGEDRAAISALSGHADLLGSSEKGNLLLGRAYENLSQNDRAVSYYQEALRLNPESWSAHNSLGSLLVKQNRLTEAIREFNLVVQLNPSESVGYSNLGVAWLHLGKVKEAKSSFEQALQRDNSAEAYNNLGVAAFYQNEYGAARAFFEAALRLRPDSDKYLAGLADALRHLNQARPAWEAYSRALRLLDDQSTSRPLYPEERARRIRCLAWLGDRSEAVSAGGAAVTEFPSNQSVLYSVALLEGMEGRSKAQARGLAQAIRFGYPAALLEHDPDLIAAKTSRVAP
jgi:serine/threonine protein kinase/tetratricopeptide (TPR) repeat protein